MPRKTNCIFCSWCGPKTKRRHRWKQYQQFLRWSMCCYCFCYGYVNVKKSLNHYISTSFSGICIAFLFASVLYIYLSRELLPKPTQGIKYDLPTIYRFVVVLFLVGAIEYFKSSIFFSLHFCSMCCCFYCCSFQSQNHGIKRSIQCFFFVYLCINDFGL